MIFQQTRKEFLMLFQNKVNFLISSRAVVPNLGYICFSEGVHLRLAIE